jgi:glucose-6-phosphate 1-epimerase
MYVNNNIMSAAAAKDPIVITHAISGARCTIYPHGAHLTSYVNSHGREVLFLSRDAALDGSRAIRGGVPLCFPQFGRPDASLPQHGFLRNNLWREVPGSRIDDGVAGGSSRVSLELSLADAIRDRGKTGDWGYEETEYDAAFTYTVSIDGSGFETTIVMENRGATPWKFQVLLHNYFSVQDGKALDGEACNVSGLGGYAVHDKVTGKKSVLPLLPGPDDHPLVTVPTESIIDREYSPPAGTIDLDLTVNAGGPSNVLSLKARGEVDGIRVPVSAVIWNPHRDNAMAMADFGDDQYVDMICVEPGLLRDVPVLGGGKKASFTQIVRCL